MIPLRLVANVQETERTQPDPAREWTQAYCCPGQYRRPLVDMARIVEQVRAILAETTLPQGYTAALEGTFQAQEQAA